MQRLIYSLVLILVLFSQIYAQNSNFIQNSTSDEISLEYAGSALWNIGYDIKIRGDYAYCGMVNGIQVLDISDPTNPEIVAQLFLNSRVLSIDIVDTILFAGCSSLKIISISNPLLLREISEYKTDRPIGTVKIKGNFAYILAQTDFQILDVSNPISCKYVGGLDIPSSPFYSGKIILNGNYAYVAKNHVYSIDITNPSEPIELLRYNTPYIAVDMELVDSLLYIADLSYILPAQISAITILNINDEDSIKYFDGYEVIGELHGIDIINDYAYIAAGLSGIAIFDISNPLEIFPIGCFPPVGEACNLVLKDSLMMVLNRKPSLFDFWGYDPDLCSQAEGLYYGDSLPPGATDSGLFLVFDVADADHPELIGELPHPGFCNFVTVAGDHAFVAGDQGKINIIDISNEDSLKPVCNFRNSIYENKLAAESEILLAANLIDGLQAYDISNIQTPVFLSVVDSIGFAGNVELVNKYAYITNSGGFWIVDYSDPVYPDVLGRCDIPDWPFDFLIDGNFAYVTGRYSGFHVVDISNPNNPHIAASSPEQFWCIYLAKKDNILFASGGSIIFIYDVENPLKPKLIGEIAPGSIYDISLIDKYLIVARAWDGIKIYEILDDSTLIDVAGYKTPLVSIGLYTDDKYIYNTDYGSVIRLLISTFTDIGGNDGEYSIIPSDFQLFQNYPNPFNSSTNIEFSLSKRSNIQIGIYNILGQKVTTLINKEKPAGKYSVQWDGTSTDGKAVASGIYFYQIKTNDYSEARKMMLLK